jgi:energy-coupling factor transporter transmembrane protein EcfT
MLSRGFRGEAYSLDDFEMKSRDWTASVIFLLLAGTAFWLGR